ncbi:MAG: DegV family protein [Lachnospiraceae bacterium]
MRKYKIFSDSACDLGFDFLEQEFQIPFAVSLDAETYYKEKEEIEVTDFYNQLDGVYPKTSVPSVQDFMDKFRPVLEHDEDIICITVSSELSSSYQSAQNARNMLLEEYPSSEIHIIDSRLATGPQGLMIYQMLEMSKDGKSLDEVLVYVRSAQTDCGVIFTVGDVSYLQKGGRIGSVVLKSAKSLHLKPLVYLDNGKVASHGIVRGEKSAMHKLVSITTEQFKDTDISSYIFCVGYTDEGSKPLAAIFMSEMKAAFPDSDFLGNFQIGATIGAHTGKGTFGIAYAKKG